MQTFLPYADFTRSARCLDYRRLGKQRVEALQILRALRGKSRGWRNHPAVRMWRGHDGALIDYALAICAEWSARGYRDSVARKLRRFHPRSHARPAWLGGRTFHASHRSNLLRKDQEYYGRFGWSEPSNLEYVWPV